MELRSAQIADVQQKLADVDGDERVRFWDGFSLIEAKSALKWLMKEVVATRVRCGVKEREVVEFTKQVSQERQQASEAAGIACEAQEHQDQMILINQRQQEAEDKEQRTGDQNSDQSPRGEQPQDGVEVPPETSFFSIPDIAPSPNKRY
uniref:chromosome-associated kinesin KIF4-like isoform X4 n=1 Tax=Myxine glutinosa TaxID=7769 RepID=UPI00358FCBE9